ncbi:MAG: multidrug transporter permease [Caulobacteraceae bacterium]|nr:multidrug transporter permease [Caulobacteraceae bacterium]
MNDTAGVLRDTPAPPGKEAPAERPAPARNKTLTTGLGVLAVLVVVGLGAWLFNWWAMGRFVQTTNDAFLQADQVTVAPKVAGYVEQVLVSDNEDVVAGQVLVRIDPRDPAARLDQARAQFDQGEAAIAEARAQIDQQRAIIAQAEATLRGSKASATFAAQQVARYAPLVATGAETNERLDQLHQNRDQANAQTGGGAAQVLAAKRQIETLRAQIGVTQAQMEQAAALVRQASTDVEGSEVRASIAGRVGDRSVRPGQYVQPGTRMMTVVPVQAIYLIANFKETQIGRMRPGQPVQVKVDALGSERLKGVVDSFAPGTGAQFALIPPSNATGNYTKIVQRVPVRIRVLAPASLRAALLPGLSVEAAVDTKNLDPPPGRLAARAGR